MRSEEDAIFLVGGERGASQGLAPPGPESWGVGLGLGSYGFSGTPSPRGPDGEAAEPLLWGLQTAPAGLPSGEDACGGPTSTPSPCSPSAGSWMPGCKGGTPSPGRRVPLRPPGPLLPEAELPSYGVESSYGDTVPLPQTQPLSQEARIRSFSYDSDPLFRLFRRSAPIPAREDFILKEVMLGEPQLPRLAGKGGPISLGGREGHVPLGVPSPVWSRRAWAARKPALSSPLQLFFFWLRRVACGILVP